MSTEVVTQDQLNHLLSNEPSMADTFAPTATDHSPFLSLLVSTDREQFSQSFVKRQCIPGEIIFREGEVGDTMYMVISGRVVIAKGDLDSPIILAYYNSTGAILGEMALLENQPRSATVIALDSVRLLAINRQNFRQLLEDIPSASFSIMEMLSSRLRRSDGARSTGELSQKRLISQVSVLQSEKQRLEELQRLRQETSELIIHDLRNPLSAIAVSLKMLTLMLPEEALQPNRELFSVAQASCERMQRLVDTLLEVSRMEAGETEFLIGPLDLRPLINDVISRVSILERKGIELRSQICPDLPSVLADQDKIERVLTNLIDNALKYTPENGLITFAAEVKEGCVQISATDTGPGIPPDQRERIFERFAQVDSERRARRGFGLGLAYCRLAVERHGGRIWIESGDEGIGSRFIFTLPCTP